MEGESDITFGSFEHTFVLHEHFLRQGKTLKKLSTDNLPGRLPQCWPLTAGIASDVEAIYTLARNTHPNQALMLAGRSSRKSSHSITCR
jgi:hypothetical protein